MTPDTDTSAVSQAEGPVRRTIRLLGAIADADGPVTIQSVAEQLALPPSTVHRLLQTLRGEGVIERHPDRPEYRIGPAWYRMAARVVAGMDTVELARPVVQRIGAAAGEACLFGLYLPREGALTFVLRQRSPDPLGYEIRMNEPLPLSWGATGKAILAHLPDTVVDDILAAREPSPATGRALDTDAVRADLAVAREQGYVVSRGERLAGAVGIASPVFGAFDQVIGSLSLTVPQARFDPAATEDLGRLVREQAEVLSTTLGATIGGART